MGFTVSGNQIANRGNRIAGNDPYSQRSNQAIPYAQGQFTGTPYDKIGQYLGGQWQGALQSGNKSGQTEYGRQLDDLYRFMAIMGNGPNAQFDIGARNLNRGMGNAGNMAQSNAAALSASLGRVNPMGAITNAGSQARAPYVQALGGLEGQRAQAQQQFLMQLLQYLQGGGQQRAQQNAYNEANSFQWEDLLPSFLGLGGQLGAAAIMGKK